MIIHVMKKNEAEKENREFWKREALQFSIS